MTNKSDDISTGLYVHIPFCRSKCAYCGFVSCPHLQDASAYVDALIREIEERVRCFCDTVFIGGGTPSVLPHGLLLRIIETLRTCAVFTSDCEITVEANPDSCTDAFLDEICRSGANRLSLGVQSLNDAVLYAVGRRHTAEQAVEAIRRAQKYGIKNISCDLMLGLPEQTEQDVREAVERLCALGITHMSVYALSVEEGTPLYKSGYRLDEDAAAKLYELAYTTLNDCGLRRYEVSNFCREGYACAHNRKYWTLQPYIGLGAAAHSFYNGKRTYNTSDIGRYISGDRDEHGNVVSGRERYEEYVMLGLRTSDGILFSHLDRLYGGDWRLCKQEQLAYLTINGWIENTAYGIKLCEKAYFVMNEIIVRLL